MKRQYILTCLLLITSLHFVAQNDTISNLKKKRLDFAKGYFELGANYYPSFTGKRLNNNTVESYQNPKSLNSTLYWGGYHFWGKAEFYVSFPLKKFVLKESDEVDVDFKHYAITGARFYPWAIQEKKIRPYIGVSWSALDYKQIIKRNDELPRIQKNFELGLDAGLIYNYKDYAIRLGVNYFPNNEWKYPISKTTFETIKTPNYGVSLGLIYTNDYSKENGDEKLNEKWNKYPSTSSLGYDATSFGDFFIGAGPSVSFSLESAEYNNLNYSYLNPKEGSKGYFDIVVGYQFNKWNLFSALSFRNPKFVREGFDMKQTVKKTSIALEVNKFLTDYSGFAPYIGLNLAYDNISYLEKENANTFKDIQLNQMQPGVTIGWDIVPGKTNEALILRTNLRWYPFSSFKVAGTKFNFSQLEYNLIQLVFYPERFLKNRNK